MNTRQHGAAIVLAMGVVALAVLAATEIMVSQSTWSRQVELTSGHVQSQLIIQTGLDWVRAVLSDDRRTSNVDYLDEPWAMRLPPIQVENGSLVGYIEDQDGKFNLNNLLLGDKLNLAQLARFRRLLSILALPPALADTLADWVDPDSEPQSRDGAEDNYYLSLQPPYLTANRLLTDVAELALVRGFDKQVRTQLRPFVTALPRVTAINANTASAEVLTAVVAGLDLDTARTIVAQRKRIYFRDYSDFFNQLPPSLIVSKNNISVSSDFFIATMLVTSGRAQARGSALLERENDGWPAIVWRQYR